MSAHNDVADTLRKLRHLAKERQADEPLLYSFIPRYYGELPDEDVDDRRVDEAFSAAIAHLRLGMRRAPGEILVEVLSPEVARDGWESDRSILMFVSDDVPFLVDTVRMVVEQHPLSIHLLVHPMLDVERDDDHMITAFGKGRGLVEAWTLFEIDRCPEELVDVLEREVSEAIAGVQLVVDDFAAMQGRLRELADGDELLTWLADEHFVFLGAASYHVADEGLTLQAGSELGDYRSGRLDPGVLDPPHLEGGGRVVIARTDAVACVHRSAYDVDRDPSRRRKRGTPFRRAAGIGRLPPERVLDPRGQRHRRRRGRSDRHQRREPHWSRGAQRHRDVAT